MPRQKQLFKHVPTLGGIALYYGIILVDLLLILGKDRNASNALVAEVSSHISNFAISSLLVSLLAFIMTLQGAPFKFVIWLGVIAILMNFIVEVLINFLNTPDILDAVYGTAGVVLTVAAMYVFSRIGLREPSEK